MTEQRDMIRPSQRDINKAAGRQAAEEVRRMLAERAATKDADEKAEADKNAGRPVAELLSGLASAPASSVYKDCGPNV